VRNIGFLLFWLAFAALWGVALFYVSRVP